MKIDQLTESQNEALALMLSGENTFVTGEAGSGKSYLINEFVKIKSKSDYPLLSSTGMSAVLIGGRTFHSFFGLGIMEGGVEKTVERAIKDRRVIKRLQKASGLIIDEISMLDGPTLEAAEKIACIARDFDLLPWGGLQIIAVGDFLQLPPVNTNRSQKAWAFQHPIWQRSRFHNCVLKENKRAKDPEFLKILNALRKGEFDDNIKNFFLEKTNLDESVPAGSDKATFLYPRKYQTDEHNLKKLDEIDNPHVSFKSVYMGQERFVERLKKFAPLPDEIILKKEAYVMLRRNDPKGHYVNGSTGILKDIDKEFLIIELINGKIIELEKATFSLLDAEGKEVAAVINFPISLAYATTIHKAQGMTLDRLVVNLKSLWEPGQAYVAVSRVRDPKNLFIQDWSASSIKADTRVLSFYEGL